MKKLYALPLAVLFVAACSESTAPESAADLSPSYAKPIKTPPPTPVAGTLINHTFNFEGDIGTADGFGGANWGSESQTGGAASSPNTVTAPAGNGTTFLGRFQEVTTMAILAMPANVTKYSLTFDLYIIGSWDGRGKQAQSGHFDANVFTVAYRCNGASGPGTPMFETSFSNQLTVQQDFPLPYLQGGNKAGTGSVEKDALGYRGFQNLSNTPPFRSFGDITYRLTYSGTNPCGAGVPLAFVFRSSADPVQQNMWDESWGLDNVIVKAD